MFGLEQQAQDTGFRLDENGCNQMNSDTFLVDGCPLCEIFSKGRIITKLYWPEDPRDIPTSEFVIVDCSNCKIPMVVYNEHVTSISRESWGRILYRSKMIFGRGITLRLKRRTIRDHWHAHIEGIIKYDK